MTKLKWHDVGSKVYETGISNGVLYVNKAGKYETGVPWNGLIKVAESPSGAESTPIYADNTKYLNLVSAEEFGASIEAYTYPDEFAECDGSAELMSGVMIGQQDRSTFGLAYKTIIGNDAKGQNYGYKIHIIYGAQAAPSEREYSSINDSPEAITFSWELTTTPVAVAGHKPTASIIIDSTKSTPEKMKKLEDKLFGSDSPSAVATLPMPNEIVTLLT